MSGFHLEEAYPNGHPVPFSVHHDCQGEIFGSRDLTVFVLEPLVEAMVFPCLGKKGFDGFSLEFLFLVSQEHLCSCIHGINGFVLVQENDGVGHGLLEQIAHCLCQVLYGAVERDELPARLPAWGALHYSRRELPQLIR